MVILIKTAAMIINVVVVNWKDNKMSDKKIYVPAGKTLIDSRRIYVYNGPRVVLPCANKEFTTYTDGSPLQYVEEPKKTVKKESVEPKKQVLDFKKTEEVVKPKENQSLKNDSDSKQS